MSQSGPDEMVEVSKDAVTIKRGTPLDRLQRVIDGQPRDQESAEFLVGDVRDVCASVGTKEKPSAELTEAVKGKNVGASVSLPIASVKSLIAVVLRAAK